MEKIHEELITSADDSTYDIGKYFLILSENDKKVLNKFKRNLSNLKIRNLNSYNSKNNSNFYRNKS